MISIRWMITKLEDNLLMESRLYGIKSLIIQGLRSTGERISLDMECQL